jgi:hypothetical protein
VLLLLQQMESRDLVPLRCLLLLLDKVPRVRPQLLLLPLLHAVPPAAPVDLTAAAAAAAAAPAAATAARPHTAAPAVRDAHLHCPAPLRRRSAATAFPPHAAGAADLQPSPPTLAKATPAAAASAVAPAAAQQQSAAPAVRAAPLIHHQCLALNPLTTQGCHHCPHPHLHMTPPPHALLLLLLLLVLVTTSSQLQQTHLLLLARHPQQQQQQQQLKKQLHLTLALAAE